MLRKKQKSFVPFLVITAFIIGWFAVVSSGVVRAWVASTPYWDLSGSSTVYFRVNELPSTYQSRLYNARDQWNAVSGASIILSRNDSSYDLRVFDGHIDGQWGTAGITKRYWAGDTYISWATVEVDEDEAWYTGTGTPGGSEVDLYSVLTHELGHALAINHTNNSCSGGANPTMCPVVPVGTTWMRSLENDDKNALIYLYP